MRKLTMLNLKVLFSSLEEVGNGHIKQFKQFRQIRLFRPTRIIGLFRPNGPIAEVGLFFTGILISVAQLGCASYQTKVSESRQLLQSGQPAQAVEKLKVLAEKQDGDQLVYLLDYATALQMNGQYKESNQVFLEAERLSEANDYHSASRVVGATLLSEEMIQYKGDTFEKTFMNAFLALNYLQMGELDDALVEARRINEKYLKLRGEEKKSYELNPFAKYLSALAWEADQKWDDAYISYEETYKLNPDIPGLREDLLRSAKRSQRESDYKKWKAEFPEVIENPLWGNKKAGELVIIFLQGWGPRKYPMPGTHRFPELRPESSETVGLQLDVAGATGANSGAGSYKSKMIYSVNDAAIRTLQDDFAALVARRLASMVAKDAVADEIGKKDKTLGVLAWAVMHISDRADLRQWSTLPASVQVIRVPLTPGTYEFNLKGLNSQGAYTQDSKEKQSVEVKSGKKKFVLFRSLR